MLNDAALWKSLNSRKQLILIAGPCVIETEEICLKVGSSLKRLCQRLGITYIFKASYDKANRTSAKSFRGPGPEAGLEILAPPADMRPLLESPRDPIAGTPSPLVRNDRLGTSGDKGAGRDLRRLPGPQHGTYRIPGEDPSAAAYWLASTG